MRRTNHDDKAAEQQAADRERRLYEAVTKDDARAVRDLMAKNPGLRGAKLPLGKRWPHVAAAAGALSALEALVAAGFSVEEPCDDHPETPLHYAAAKGHATVARWLLDRGAGANATDQYGRTPLMNAARDGHAEVAKLLLDRGADPHATYNQPPLLTAAMMASLYGHEAVAELLRAGEAKRRTRPSKPRVNSQRRPARAAAAPPPDLRQRIVGHVAAALGPVRELALTEIVPGTVRLAIHVVPPRRGRNWLTLFTTGCSERPMRAKGKAKADADGCPPYAEFLVKLPPKWPLTRTAFRNPNHYWPVEWLRVIAHHAHETGTCLAAGDTMGNGEPPEPFAPGTKLSCVLLLENPDVESMPLRPGAPARDRVHFYDVIPIYDEERELYEAQGLAALIKRFRRHRVSPILDPKRRNVAAAGRRPNKETRGGRRASPIS